MTGSNWWVDSFPASVSGGVAYGGGGRADISGPRDPLDAKRTANGFAPGASWPDGYLGNITDRRGDKVVPALQANLNKTSYVRGVHVGEKIGTDSYFWDQNMDPDMGLALQAQSVVEDVEGALVFQSPRFAPNGDVPERLSHQGKTIGMADAPLTSSNPARAERIRANMPRWR
jgi:hypothetical protein